MEATVNESSVLWQRLLRLADACMRFRRPSLDRVPAEADNQAGWQKKCAERKQHRYDAQDKQCIALSKEVESLCLRLYTAERQAEAFKQLACAAVRSSEDLKRLYIAASPCLDSCGFILFSAAQEITGFCLSREFPYEDACGCFEFLDGFELLRYLKASEFGAVSWELVPGTGCKKAVLRDVDELTPAYREFERQLYKRALEHLGLRTDTPSIRAD